MAQTLIVKLTDDIDGGDAVETISFSLDGKSYEIDLSEKNATELRSALAPFVDKGRSSGRKTAAGRPSRTQSGGSATLFSQLDAEEKERFRVWAELPNARRIADARVEKWIEAGRP